MPTPTPLDPYNISPEDSRNALLSGVADTGPGARGTLPPALDPGNPPPYVTPGSQPPTGPKPAADDVGSMIDSLYQKANIKDGGAGSGFADRAYWLAHPSEVLNGRLGNDLNGTGTDQPTGTPGSGPWQNSGKGALPASPASPSAPSPIAPSAPIPLAMPSALSAASQTTGASSGDAASQQLSDLQAQLNRALMLQGVQQ